MFRGLSGMLILVFIGATLLIGGTLYEYDSEQEEFRDIYNFTEQINPNFSCNNLGDLNEYQEGIRVPVLKYQRLNNIGCSLADFTITTFTEVAKFGVEFGYTHPQYDYDFYFKIVKIWIYAIILSVVLPLIIPLLALIYLIGVGIQSLLTKRKKRIIENEKQSDTKSE